MNRANEESLLGIADAIHGWSRAAGLKEGVKVLAEELDEHWVTTYARLRGEKPLTPAHLRVMAAKMGPEYGRMLWQAAVGGDYLVATQPKTPTAEDLVRAGARSMSAEGRFVQDLSEAVEDGVITRAEADKLVREATDLASLLESLKQAILRRAQR